MTHARPTVVLLTAEGVDPPTDLDAVRGIADVRECTADTLTEALPGAEILLVWDI